MKKERGKLTKKRKTKVSKNKKDKSLEIVTWKSKWKSENVKIKVLKKDCKNQDKRRKECAKNTWKGKKMKKFEKETKARKKKQK